MLLCDLAASDWPHPCCHVQYLAAPRLVAPNRWYCVALAPREFEPGPKSAINPSRLVARVRLRKVHNGLRRLDSLIIATAEVVQHYGQARPRACLYSVCISKHAEATR